MMMEDILEDSSLFQKMAQKKQKTLLVQILVHFVETHFPDLTSLANQQATQATTPQQLQEILEKLFVAHSDNEAKAALLGEQ